MVNIINTTKSKLHEIVNNSNRIFCICGGEDCVRFIEQYDCVRRVQNIIDNYKRGTYFEINDSKISCISLAEAARDITNTDTIVLTSVLFSDEILPQIDGIDKFDGMSIYVPLLAFDDRERTKSILDECKGENYQIPKVIHYCWFGKGKMPDQFLKNIETWKVTNPEYEIKRWDETNYDISKNTYMRQAYESKRWGFVPDYARLDIIYHHGGIYLDTDIELLTSLDSLRKFDFYAGFEEGGNVAFGLGFGAIVGHPIVKACMEAYEDLLFIRDDGALNLVPSPVIQTQTLLKFGIIGDGKCQRIGDGVILSDEYLAPYDTFGNGNITDNTISIHQYAATWFDDKEMNKRKRKLRNKQMLLDRARWV